MKLHVIVAPRHPFLYSNFLPTVILRIKLETLIFGPSDSTLPTATTCYQDCSFPRIAYKSKLMTIWVPCNPTATRSQNDAENRRGLIFQRMARTLMEEVRERHHRPLDHRLPALRLEIHWKVSAIFRVNDIEKVMLRPEFLVWKLYPMQATFRRLYNHWIAEKGTFTLKYYQWHRNLH